VADSVDCGNEGDVAITDATSVDTLLGCESVDAAAAPPPPDDPDPPANQGPRPPTGSVPPSSNPPQAGGGGGGGGGASEPLSLDGLARTLTVSRAGRLAVTLRGEPGTTGRVTLATARKVKVGTKRRKLTLGRATFRVGARGTVRLSLRVSPSNRRALKKLKRVSAVITATAAGQPAVTARVTVKPPKAKKRRATRSP
jgi:hypothetical protein